MLDELHSREDLLKLNYSQLDELSREIRRIDSSRAQYYRFYTGKTWGDKLNYDLCLNATETNLSVAAEAVANMVGK